MKLYDFERSGNCYKVRLLLNLLGLDYETVPVDLSAGENFKAEFLKLNPRAQVPLLEDGGRRVWDSMAILVYLARRYGEAYWLPVAAEPMSEIMQWLAVSENEILHGLARARSIKLFNRPGSVAESQEIGRGVLRLLNDHLSQRSWLAVDHITIADVACFPYVALAPEAGIPLTGYAGINNWLARIHDLPGFISMPGI
ncbi:MAG TPA: glutathione S-transferase [Gammaproteobacteria bacterium]|nr:glutathione S-transferase [Gammaproteobacteria bacterium]